MRTGVGAALRKTMHKGLRSLFKVLPRERRFALYRSFVDCDPAPSERLQLKIADTREELEACFHLLHDAYVEHGFMKPHPSGMRVTIYHALPTTTTLCAKWDGEVVGTISLIRDDSAFGFPLHTVFDLSHVRELDGNIAEVSALAVHPGFRKTGGAILFPLMKFMYEYATRYFDTRHLVIAVNPNRIEMYESLLFFQRLTANVVEKYDFANGAPAVGAWLDLKEAPQVFSRVYGGKPPRKNLHGYFIEHELPNIAWPQRRYYTTNDPVLTPDLLDYFFNVRTQGFAALDDHRKALLRFIYDLPEYDAVLPSLPYRAGERRYREHSRYSCRCPGYLTMAHSDWRGRFEIDVVDVSRYGFLARAREPLPLKVWSDASVRLGPKDVATVKVMAIRQHPTENADILAYGFELGDPDVVWNTFIETLTAGMTYGDVTPVGQ
ncbi:MAG: GNAT family N-acetyltransferase [Rhodocyclaceae bacterium]|jgi:GNAT superfamily N-acetyltransferase|nr:GNAT family N-acetyltransferase [Rhodocyclaceae bacterium]